MKHWAMAMKIMGVVLAAGLMFGCEKNQPPEEPPPYDPKVDAPPTNLQINPSPDLLADQTKLYGAKIAASATPAAGAPGEAEDPGVKAVRAEMGKIIEAAKTGQLPAIADYVLAKDADKVKDAASALGALATAEDALNKAVKAQWAKGAPASLAQALEPGPNGGPFLARLGEMSASDLAIAPVDANTREVKDRTGSRLTFQKSDDKWLISLSDAQVQVYGALAELAKLQAQMAKELTDGMAAGAVTEQNADGVIMEKAKALGEAMKRLKEAMEADQPKTGAGDGGSGEASGGSSRPATAPAGDASGGSTSPATAPAGDASGGSTSPATAPAGDATGGSSGAATPPAGDASGGSE
jgi:hypothetical protein